jgi:hypothetical protein
MAVQTSAPRASVRRRIGVVGTVVRVAVGSMLLGSVVAGQWPGPVRLGPWLLGLVGFPAVLLGWQWWRSRRRPGRCRRPDRSGTR